jgi:multisubunit Na+/H+ antiporter MnhC subunit
VVELLASAELGIALAITDKDGVEAELLTVGTSQEGQVPAEAAKFVTVPNEVHPVPEALAPLGPNV